MRPTVAALAVAFLAPLALLMVVLAGVLTLLGPGTPGSSGTAGTGASGSGPVAGVSALAAADIPPAYLALYQRAGTRCAGLDWALLAGVGKTETDHGRARLPGVASGENFAGAGGPMQFLAPTFLDVVSRNPPPPGGARPPSRYNPSDAIHTAAAYLCDSGLDTPTATPAERDAALFEAVFTYNHSSDYVRTVLARAARYRAPAPAPQDDQNDPVNPSTRRGLVPAGPRRRSPASGPRRPRRVPAASTPTDGDQSRRPHHRRCARRAGPPRPGRGRSARGSPDAPHQRHAPPRPRRASRRARPTARPRGRRHRFGLRPRTPTSPLHPPWSNDMSTTHRGVSTRFTWLFRLAGTVTVTAVLTLGATTATKTATTATAYAGPKPDPDPHSDTRSHDRNDDRDDNHGDNRKDDRSDDQTGRDSKSDTELEPGPRVGNSSTGPREETGEEQVVEVHGKWRFHTVAGANKWRESPNGQLVVTSDDVWVEVTGGPRSWCFDGATGQQRFPRKTNTVVRCG